jgi:hypothetical protein
MAIGSEKITARPATPRLVARIRHSSALNMARNMSWCEAGLKSVLFARV